MNTHRPPGDVTVTLEQDGVEFNPATLTFTKANNWTERHNVSVVLTAAPRATTTVDQLAGPLAQGHGGHRGQLDQRHSGTPSRCGP